MKRSCSNKILIFLWFFDHGQNTQSPPPYQGIPMASPKWGNESLTSEFLHIYLEKYVSLR